MVKNKKLPMRTCSGCRQTFLKKELIRIVRTTENKAAVDFSGKMNGRGTYICKNLVCLEKARRSGSISRSLQVEVPPDVYESLKAELISYENG